MGQIRRIRRSAAVWRELFSQQTNSGLSVSEFCRREQINSGLFRRWRLSLQDSGKEIRVPVGSQPAVAAPAPFIELGGIGMGGPRFEVRLDLGSGIVLSIARG